MISRGLLQRLSFIVVVTAICVVAVSPAGEAQDSFRVVGVKPNDALNVRAVPGADAKVSGTIPSNATGIQSIGECNAWCLVRYRDLVGWVDRQFLQTELDQTSIMPTADAVLSNLIEDCNSDDSKRQLDGCSRLVKQTGLGAAELAVAHSRRSDAYLAAGNLDGVIGDRSKALELQPNEVNYKRRLSQAYQLRAAVAQIKGNHKEALADYGTAIRIDPSNPGAYAGRSELFFEQKEPDKGIADLKIVLQLDNSQLYRLRLSKEYENSGIGHLLKKEYDRAVADLSGAIELDESNAGVRLHRGAAYIAKGNIDSAIKDYSEAIRLGPDLAEPRLRRGELLLARGAALLAFADFDEAIKRDGKNIAALMLRGLAREESGQLDGAMSDYNAVLQIEPTNAHAKSSLTRLDGGAIPNLPPETKTKVEKAAAPPIADPPAGIGRFDGTWMIVARSETCRLRPDGSHSLTYAMKIARGAVQSLSQSGARISGRVSEAGQLVGSFPTAVDGGLVRFQATIRGNAGAGRFSRPDGKCDGTFTMRRG